MIRELLCLAGALIAGQLCGLNSESRRRLMADDKEMLRLFDIVFTHLENIEEETKEALKQAVDLELAIKDYVIEVKEEERDGE